MIIWPPKDPAETVAYSVDWRDLDCDWIANQTLSVVSGDAVIGENNFSGNVIGVLISGGTDGTTTTFNSHIETYNGQILDRTITLYTAAGAVSSAPSTATKRLVVKMAYAKCRLAGYEFQLDPAELDNALLNLDLLMEEWAVSGKDLGYNMPIVPGDGNLEDPIGIPNAALNGVSWYLALMISPEMGKTLSAEARKAMADAMANVSAMTVRIPTMAYPRNTPAGAGNRRYGYAWGRVFMPTRRC